MESHMITALEIADLRGDHGYVSPGPPSCVSDEEDWPCIISRLMDDRDALLGALERNMPKHTLHHDWCDEEPCSCGVALLEEATRDN